MEFVLFILYAGPFFIAISKGWQEEHPEAFSALLFSSIIAVIAAVICAQFVKVHLPVIVGIVVYEYSFYVLNRRFQLFVDEIIFNKKKSR